MLTQIGTYRVECEIGRGGMGVVYKATDSRLGRAVAIKALPEHFADDPERLARFEREARTLATLNHPNVAGIYGVEEHEGRRYLVLEYVEGETLADRLDGGPLPVDEAIDICAQVAAGLEAAHEAGVVHRDLKPANIRMTPDGKAKVLDFGLARADDVSSSGSSVSQMPTLTTPASPTTPGAILGTAPYMSPEQARGRKVDKRSDIWSFGVVLYECLTGVSPFVGDTISDSIGAILHKDLDLALLPARTPPGARRALERCLRRDRAERWRDIGDARLELLANAGDGTVESQPVARVPVMSVALLIVIAFALGGAATMLINRSPAEHTPARPARVERLEIPLHSESGSLVEAVAVSPDGSAIAYVLDGRLWIRQLDSFDPTPVDGGDGATLALWSPDSAQLAFAKGAMLWKVDSSGRRPQQIGSLPSEVSNVGGGVWRDDGRILVSTGNQNVLEIPSTGGAWREYLAVPSGSTDMHEIAALPGRDALFVTLHRLTGPWQLAIWDGETFRILDALGKGQGNVCHPAWSPSGHIVYEQQGQNAGIWAAPFSIESLELTGPPFKISSSGEAPCMDDFGTLIYSRRDAGARTLAWVDPVTGESTPFSQHEKEALHDPYISLDGQFVAYSRADIPGRDIWMENLSSGARVRLTSNAEENWYPKISPDNLRVAVTEEVLDPPGWRLRIYAADGSGPTGQPVEVFDIINFDREWTTVVFDRQVAPNDIDVWAWDLNPEHDPRPIVTGPGDQVAPAISPDGKWLAFVEKDDRGLRLFLTQFPDAVTRWQVTENFAAHPRWTPDGSKLMYATLDSAIEIIDVSLDKGVQFGPPRRLVAGESRGFNAFTGYALHPADGRLLVPQMPPSALESPSIGVVRNWAIEFSR